MLEKPSFVPPMASTVDVHEHYRRRYATHGLAIAAVDGLMGLLIRSQRPDFPRSPSKILVANAGHIGDCIISTPVLSVLRHAFPDAMIGFLTGRYSKAVIGAHPLVDRVHYLDHWRASRDTGTPAGKAYRYYFRDRPAVVRELRAEGYDIALDLHAWFPNSVVVLWMAGIPVRIGFDRVGGGPLLTHPMKHVHDRRQEIDHKLDLLRAWNLPQESMEKAALCLAAIDRNVRERVPLLTNLAGPYCVLHPASSLPTKDWRVERWAELAENLIERGMTPVITGLGGRDARMAADIVMSMKEAMRSRVVNAVDAVKWPDLMALLAEAHCVYSVDTSIGHAARVFGTPVVSIYGGMADPLHWAPAGARIVTHEVPCSPCFRKRGCAHRACINEVTVSNVLAAGENAIERL